MTVLNGIIRIMFWPYSCLHYTINQTFSLILTAKYFNFDKFKICVTFSCAQVSAQFYVVALIFICSLFLSRPIHFLAQK